MLFYLLVVLMFFTFIANMIVSFVYEGDMWYLGLVGAQQGVVQRYLFPLVSAFILYQSIIPISLAITVEGVKFVQSYFFAWDVEMYDGMTW